MKIQPRVVVNTVETLYFLPYMTKGNYYCAFGSRQKTGQPNPPPFPSHWVFHSFPRHYKYKGKLVVLPSSKRLQHGEGEMTATEEDHSR